MTVEKEAISRQDVHLLVLGAPRSGTSLLSAMLSCHPEISLLNEELTGASLSIFAKRIKGVKLCAPHQIELENTMPIRIHNRIRGQFRRVGNIVRRITGQKIPLSAFRTSKISIRQYEQRVDKLHVIGIVRNPEQVINSMMGRGNQSRKTATYRWTRLIDIFHILLKDRKPTTDITLVDFNKLVVDPEQTMRDCLAALGCEYTPEVLEGFKHTPQYKGRSEIDKSKAGKNLDEVMQYPLLAENPQLAKKFTELLEITL